MPASEVVKAWFGPAVVAALVAVRVPVSSARVLNLLELITAWKVHVDRIEAELPRSLDDRSVWVADDLVASLVLRDHLEIGLGHLDGQAASAALTVAKEIDNRFLAMTERDTDGCVVRVMGGEFTAEGWWWSRIPVTGPIRQELDESFGHIAGS
ncbi:MAG TPA: hypothetical protein VNV66_19130 [Pilimelia sp.]|nr:hypothetical protein [Pilimelia sp.]